MNAAVDYAFLHGGAQGGWVWAETIAALDLQTGGGFGRALALDVPGCGAKRGRPTEGLGPDEIAAELIEDIESAGLKDLVLVGHSQAGSILPRMVEQRPDLFRRLVYVSCLAPPPGKTVLEASLSEPAGAAAANARQEPFDPQAVFRALFCNDMSEAESLAFLAKLGEDAWPAPTYTARDWRYDHLGAVPASYVLCLQDKALSTASQETYAERLKASRLTRLDGGHQIMNTRPHALAEVLRREAAQD